MNERRVIGYQQSYFHSNTIAPVTGKAQTEYGLKEEA